jgi:hypothetical protein
MAAPASAQASPASGTRPARRPTRQTRVNRKVLLHGPVRHRLTARYSTTKPHSPNTIMKQPTRR